MANGESLLVAIIRILADRCKWSCCSDLVSQIVGFVVSFSLTWFDIITDWIVVGNFHSNPLLPTNYNSWMYAWIVFSLLGTVFAVYSSINDFVLLVHDWKLKRSHYKRNDDEGDTNCVCYFGREHDCCWKGCTDCGCNRITRSESLVALTVWLHSYPILALGLYYAFVQPFCPTPYPQESADLLLSVGLSMIASALVFLSTLLRSLTNVIFSMWIGRDSCEKWEAKSLCAMKCLPERDAAACPHNMSGVCRFGLVCGSLCSLVIQGTIAILAFIIVLGGAWGTYGTETSNEMYSQPLGIYPLRISSATQRIVDVSNVISANGVPINRMEKIISYGFSSNEFDVGYCAFSFEYRAKDFDIYYNMISLIPVSGEGEFCGIISDPSGYTVPICDALFDGIQYASYISGRPQPKDPICRIQGLGNSPSYDKSINMLYRLNQEGFTFNNKPVVIYFIGPESEFTVPVLSALDRNSSHVVQFSTLNFSCAINFTYEMSGYIRFNVRDVNNYPMSGCTCDSNVKCTLTLQHQLAYGYVTPEGNVTQYTQCFTIPLNELVPIFDSTIPVACPCSR